MERRITLGELTIFEVPPEEETVYNKFISILDEFYPDDWRAWEVNDLTFEDLFGPQISSEDENRIRFAIPMVQLAQAFSSGTPCTLGEKTYRKIKRTLLKWPIARAVIYTPSSTMKKIHSLEGFNRFSEVVKQLKPKLMSRSDASSFLKSRSCSNVGAEAHASPASSAMSSNSRKRSHSPTSSEEAGGKIRREPEDSLMAKFMNYQNMLLEKKFELSHGQNQQLKAIKDHLADQPARSPTREYNDQSGEESWQAPDIIDSDTEEEPEQTDEPLLDFDPDTKESEAKISAAEEDLVKQGIHCQRLGNDGWHNVRYADVQKKFQAAPVFTNLKVNSTLATVTPSWQLVTILEKMDLCLGAITHGLLQQRKEFQNIYYKASLEVKSHISKNFLSQESTFRKTSDALLQYTCGKRAEVIQHRRNLYKPHNKTLNELLQSIPPSPTHLFAEPQLADLVKEQGGTNKFFPASNRKSTYKYKATYDNQQNKERTKPFSSFKRPSYKAPERTTNRTTGRDKRPFHGKQKSGKSRYEGRKHQV